MTYSGLGVENVSLAMEYPEAPAFRSAGYANIDTNSSYVGGMVRQNGNVSFSRVFEAGHSVTAYQPETVYRIFKRSTFGLDIATGQVKISAGEFYSSKGPSNIFHVKNKLPEGLAPMCFLYQAPKSCTDVQLEALENGTAVVRDFIIISPSAETEVTSNKTSGDSSTSTPAAKVSEGSQAGLPHVCLLLACFTILSSLGLLGVF